MSDEAGATTLRRRGRILAALGVAVGATGACTAILGDFSSGDASVASDDAAAPRDGGRRPDAPRAMGRPDSGGVSSSAGQASSSGALSTSQQTGTSSASTTTLDAGCDVARYCCMRRANLCEDFDEGTALPWGWTEVQTGGVGAVLISNSGFGPSPGSLQSTMNTGASGVAELITRAASGSASEFMLSFELLADESCTATPQTVAVLEFGADDNPAVVLRGGGSFATLAAGFTSGQTFTPYSGAEVMISTASWTEVTLEVLFSGERTAILTVPNGTSTSTETPELVADGGPTVALGLGSSEGCTIYVDNVTLDWN